MKKRYYDAAIFHGPPKNWGKISDQRLKDQLSLVNPNYNIEKGFRDNCVNCVIAYDLRQRGYDVVAKSRAECNVSNKATQLWYNVTEHHADTINQILNFIDLSVDAYYFLGIKFRGQNGHAVLLSVKEKNVTILDPQCGNSYDVSSLQIHAHFQFSYWWIDNLEVTQTGYNACKGGSSYDI